MRNTFHIVNIHSNLYKSR